VRLAAFVALSVLAFIATSTSTTIVSADEAQNKKVEAIFASFVKPGQPGGSVIVLKDGKEVYKGAFGMADVDKKTPLKVGSIYHIASVSKQMTAIGILMMQEEGKLKVDDPIGKYLPELAHFGDKMTIRTLLTHTSGIPMYGNEDFTNAVYNKSETPVNKDVLEVLKTAKAIEKPGEVWEYGNVGYQMLALVLEKLSGKPYEVFLKERIFDKLGMKNTFSMPTERRKTDANVPHSYSLDENNKPYAYDEEPSMDGLIGAGSVYSTVEDLALYDAALSGEALVKQSTLAEMFKPFKLNDGTDSNYGFGWMLDPFTEDVAMYSHPGTHLAFRAQYDKFPDQKLTIITLFNRDYGFPDDDPSNVALKIAEVFLQN
jgi:CubicO group peptidase (beta-lactamase class C family)